MKRSEVESVVAPLVGRVAEVCESAGAPLVRVVCDGAVNRSQAGQGCVGRVYLILGDDKPGWRSKDGKGRRRALKAAVQAVLADSGVKLAVHVQAGYSCLTVEGGLAVRRDDTGRVVGAYSL